jgi:glycosyltransferase involved in cell wall biosynthesis
MRRHLAEAAIFASPALYEPFGLTVLEAAAAGCALVLGDIASLRENWEGAAIFLPPGHASEWQAALARLIDDGQERDRLAAAARIRAQRFTLANTARRYRALYYELCGCERIRDRAKGRAA